MNHDIPLASLKVFNTLWDHRRVHENTGLIDKLQGTEFTVLCVAYKCNSVRIFTTILHPFFRRVGFFHRFLFSDLERLGKEGLEAR